MNSPERVYALLVEANPIPDPHAMPPVPPAPSLALPDERRSVMLTQEPTETKYITARPRWWRAAGAFAAVLIVIGAGVGIWAVATDGGPVAAGDARIEVTFSGDVASYVGHREIVEGIAEVTFINESAAPAWLMIHRYETGSAALTDELAFIQEGGNALPGDKPPSGAVVSLTSFVAGDHIVATVLRPGTYVLDAGPDNDEPTHVYRAAVIEVVSD